MKRLVVLAVLALGLSVPPAFAVNDPTVPGDNCAPANAEAVGHPAFSNNQTPPSAANPPFSANNPGESTGAQGSANSEATEHCPNAQP
jgi:hypothetical protein